MSKKSEGSLHNLLDTKKWINFCIIEVPRRKREGKRTEGFCKENGNFPNLERDLCNQVHETHKPVNKIKEIPSRTQNKTVKNQRQGQNLPARRGGEKKFVTYKGIPIRPSADFWVETLQPRREWEDILKELGKILPIKHNLCSKTVLQKWRSTKDLPRQTRAEEIPYH